ncbi:MAG: hypothetical protein AAB908_01970 [Patescibacteria group bacterium]
MQHCEAKIQPVPDDRGALPTLIFTLVAYLAFAVLFSFNKDLPPVVVGLASAVLGIAMAGIWYELRYAQLLAKHRGNR